MTASADREEMESRAPSPLRLLAWLVGLAAISLLSVSAVMLARAADPANGNWLESQVNSVVVIGAVIVGLVILNRQPQHRIGWLWLLYGTAAGFRTLGHGIYYFNGAGPAGYSTLQEFFMWSTEPANLMGFTCLVLLLLWFPDGQPISRRWRVLYVWLALALAAFAPGLLSVGSNWNGGAEDGGIAIDNPYGMLPPGSFEVAAALGFFSIVFLLILAAVSQAIRYRRANEQARLQIRWFVFGGFLLILLGFTPVFLPFGGTAIEGTGEFILTLIGFFGILPLYLAVGVAIRRHRLYEIDLIIRRTLQYAVVTSLLAGVYFGGVVVLQGVIGPMTGNFDSPLVTVITTLGIAALFNPLRNRVQAFIDRRFFRKSYVAEQILARFGMAARDEVDMERLTDALLGVAAETMQPVKIDLRLRSAGKR